MKKRYLITAFIFGFFGIIYGAFCNYFVRVDKSIFLSIMSGFFVGILYFFMYYILTFFLGFQYDDNSKKELDKYMKLLIRIQNLIVFNALLFGSSLLIASGGQILLPLFWIHLADIVIALIIIAVANFDGKRIRKARAKATKSTNVTPSPAAKLLSSEQVMHLISTAPNTDIANQIVESITGLTEPRDKILLIKELFSDSMINVSLSADEYAYLDILNQVMVKNKNKENTP